MSNTENNNEKANSTGESKPNVLDEVLDVSFYVAVTDGEGAFTQEEIDFLNSITVGGLKLDSSELSSMVKNATYVAKLTESTYPTWLNGVRGYLTSVTGERAMSLLNGGIGASDAAYRRFFGKAGDWTAEDGDSAKYARLLPLAQVKTIRDQEMAKVRSFLLATLSPDIMQVFDEATTRDAVKLWKAINDRYTTNPHTAKYMLIAEIDKYQPTKDQAMSIVGDELATLYSKYYSMTGKTLEESDKVRHLIKAAKVVAGGRGSVLYAVNAIEQRLWQSEATSGAFEEARKMLSVADQNEPKIAAPPVQRHDQGHPHMFQAYGPQGFMYGQPQNPGAYALTMRGNRQQYPQSQPAMQGARANPNMRCWHCGGPNHTTRECRHKEAGRPAETSLDNQGNLCAPDGTIIRYFYEAPRSGRPGRMGGGRRGGGGGGNGEASAFRPAQGQAGQTEQANHSQQQVRFATPGEASFEFLDDPVPGKMSPHEQQK